MVLPVRYDSLRMVRLSFLCNGSCRVVFWPLLLGMGASHVALLARFRYGKGPGSCSCVALHYRFVCNAAHPWNVPPYRKMESIRRNTGLSKYCNCNCDYKKGGSCCDDPPFYFIVHPQTYLPCLYN